MGRPKLYHTEEERRESKKRNQKKYISNPEKKQQQLLANKKTQSERFRRWQQNNKHKVREKAALERAIRLQRMPKWADIDAIKEFYKNCPDGYHVDHIIPLRGKTVSGLHIVENLQYLTSEENLKKGNNYFIL